MKPIVDPRRGDVDDDASSTRSRSLFALAGTLLAEISFSKFIFAWMLLIGLPALLLGAAPLLLTIWLTSVSSAAYSLLTGLLPAVLLAFLVGLGWFGRGLLRIAEDSFWSLNALAIQPLYALVREGLRHGVEASLPSGLSDSGRASARAISSALAGLLICAVALWIAALSWPSTRWLGALADLGSPWRLLWLALHNSVVLVSLYLAGASLVWGFADATMAQPRDLKTFQANATGRKWRVAHLSDLHMVGERYGFRIECGRTGPQGNDRIRRIFDQLRQIHDSDPLHAVLMTGDVTDAGLSSEWSEFFDILSSYPELARIAFTLPGNHDLNVVDRTNPARLDLPMSPRKRLRQIRMMSALEALQGQKVRLMDADRRQLGGSLSDHLQARRGDIETFADRGSFRLSWPLAALWADCFPMIVPPTEDDGLGIILLNSNVEAHFSFTNALGLVNTEQAKAIDIATAIYPRSYWIVALHHHVIEYPKRAKAFSERIGTALINGSWFIRGLKRLSGRVVVMHGHRHIDWLGECGGIPIISAPSAVMEATNDQQTYFLVHTLAVAADGTLGLMKPERVEIAGVAT